MAEAFVNVTEGSGKKLHHWDRTIGANSVLDEFVLPGEYPLASYSISAAGISGATAAAHLCQVMAGASLNVRIRSITVTQMAAPAAVVAYAMQIFRLTTAGTGGTAVTPRRYESSDAAAGATAMTLPTVKGTESDQLWQEATWLGTAAIPTTNNRLEWPNYRGTHGVKSILIPAGTANGIAIKIPAGVAASTFDIAIEIVETSFL